MSEFIDLLHELSLGFNRGEQQFSYKHFVEYKASTPHITFLVIVFQVEDLWCCIKWGTSAFSHHDINISGKSEISDFEIFMLIKKNIIRFKIPVNLVCE